MRGTKMTIVGCVFLAACASRTRGPETPKIDDNEEATHRVDILPMGHGSAVVIDAENGLLLTCHHVAGDGRRELIINIAEGDAAAVAYPAKVVGWDEVHDLAVIKVERRFTRAVVLADLSEVHLLDDVYNIGFPYDLGELGSKGAVKTVDYDLLEGDEDALLIELDGVPGTSGSGIFLARNGKLIGLMRALIPTGPNDGRQIVVRVAIRIDTIRKFLDGANIGYLTSFPGQGPVAVGDGTSQLERVTISIPPPSK
ncbi:MAG: serine protease [Patescibacteria group bacterium]